jgi:hypothetical protein
MDVVASNKAIKDGTMPKLLESTMSKFKPEASYFFPSNGKRCCIMIFDMKDASEMPSAVEPFFLEMNADVELTPVMNAGDLQKGLKVFMKSMG